MTATTYERLKKIVVEQLGVDEEQVTPEASFVDDLNADSLDLVELISWPESTARCCVPPCLNCYTARRRRPAWPSPSGSNSRVHTVANRPVVCSTVCSVESPQTATRRREQLK